MTTGTEISRWQRLRHADPTIAIVLMAAAVHLVRRAPLDTFVFALTAVLILVDRRHQVLRRSSLDARLAAVDPRWGDVAAIAYGAAIGALPAGSIAVKLTMAVPGIVAVAAVLRARPPDALATGDTDAETDADGAPVDHGAPLRRVRPWAVVFVLAALWELTSFVQQPSPTVDSHDHPVLSSIIGPQLDDPWRRAIAAAVWFAVGCRLVRLIVRAGITADEPDVRRAGGMRHREAG